MLEQLGVENFGIYNVVAGIVGFLGILNGTLVSATQRFLAYELGSGDVKSYNNVFSMLVTIFIFISLALLILAFAFGPYLIYNFIVIPDEKRVVAMWVYYFSVGTFFVSLITTPYVSSIIAHENFGIYSFISFVEVILKLLLVYGLYLSKFDKLLTYGFLTMGVSFLLSTIYCIYCIYKIKGCKYNFFFDKFIFHKLISYISWNLFGSVTTILNYQGQTLLLNFFFGPLVNASKSIADKINTTVGSFSNNYFMAVRPQIIKSYASGNYNHMFKLVNQSTKFSFFLLFLVTMPLIILMQGILKIWLGPTHVTDNMVLFSQLMLLFSLVNVFENPITTMIQATGNIKKYEIIIGSGVLLVLPICYLFFKNGLPSYYSLVVLIVTYFIAHLFRIIIANQQLGLSIRIYFNYVVVSILISVIPSVFLSYYICKLFSDNFFGLINSYFICLLISLLFIFCLGLDKFERNILTDFIKRKLRSKK